MKEFFKKVLEQSGTDEEKLRERLRLACEWISDIAQVKSENDPVEKRHLQKKWTGAVKGEYSVANSKWSFFCPVWHSGQAVKSLTMAYAILNEKKFLDAAVLGADFIKANTIPGETSDESLILAFEDHPDKVNTSAIMECMDGLLLLNAYTNDAYRETFLKAAEWIVSHAWLKGKGLYRDLYDPGKKVFLEKAYGGHEGRPLLEDGVLLKAFKLSGKTIFRDAFFESTDRLLKDEYPEGNWLNYVPCRKETGTIHPRHAYWWGYPMFQAYKECGEKKYLDCALRSCRWYVKAQRKDGGLIRGTYLDFSTDSFGHATSGIAAAMSMFCDAMKISGTDEFLEPLAKALNYCMKMQFVNPQDKNLKGAILEKVLPPDGTDRSPYHIRDLGTIFFIQGASKILELK
ncbi:MAG: hypothetical protein A2017_15940 [Lentisphaerae bacterium GWF2_44_16]|nr:MAG: hypothetical protein A2017_15940 [Lentisphaerae bacterium GWF2_44_16]